MRKLAKDDLKSFQPENNDGGDSIDEFAQKYLNVPASYYSLSLPVTVTFEFPPKEYIEPERDEQGTFYGYKILVWLDGKFFSPVHRDRWNDDGSLTSDRLPSESNQSGIYSLKKGNDPDLRLYFRSYQPESVLVKVALSGTVVEGETGFRSEQALIVSILVDGNWISYEELQRRSYEYRKSYEDSQGYSLPDSDEERKWRYMQTWKKDRFIGGNWNTNT